MNKLDNNKYNEHQIKLNNLVFNNIVIRRNILFHLNKFNILFVNIEFKTIEQWQQFKYKEYLHNVTLNFDFDFYRLPQNIKIINFGPHQLESPPVIPNHIESVRTTLPISNIEFLIQQPSYLSKLVNLTLKWKSYQVIQAHTLPQSITELNLDFELPKLPKNVLPNNLKKLSLTGVALFEDGCFPESLDDVSILKSTPLILNQLSPNGNLTRLNFRNSEFIIGNNIKLLNSIKDLSISCKALNTPLPMNLKKLNLFIKQYENEIEYPSSLEELNIGSDIFSKSQLQSYQLPNNLKTLYLNCSKVMDSIFLKKEFRLPSSLMHLFLGEFTYNFEIGILPLNLQTLITDYEFNHEIIPFAIPSNLKLFKIYNHYYSNEIPLTPSSHPYTAISINENPTMGILSYYNHCDTQLRVLRLYDGFNKPLSTLLLCNKSKLEYFHLGRYFNQTILSSDLPFQNNIKTLELSHYYDKTINLEMFKNLETLIILSNKSNPTIITTTTTINGKTKYNNYNLKNILVSPNNKAFLVKLDFNFYSFLKYINNKNNMDLITFRYEGSKDILWE